MSVREKPGISVRLTTPRAHNAVGFVRRISDPRSWAGLCLLAAFSTPAWAAEQDSWTIRILPATKLVLAQPGPSQPGPVKLGPALAAPAPPPHEPSAKSAAYDPAPAPKATHAPAHTNAGGPQIIPNRPHAAGPPRRPGYSDVYRSIPFSRAEYVAHPSYRSEATLGLLLNQMPYPSTGAPRVPQYGYVTPYSFDNTFGTPTFSSTFYWMPLSNW
jgi:hypothetical protein